MRKQYSVVRADTIECSLWLAFTASGDVRMSRGQPALGIGERAVSLTIMLPTALFKIPQLSARLTIDAPDPSTVPQIDVRAAEAALRSVVGCDVSITVN